MIVTLDQATQHLRVDEFDEDELIQMYIDAAENYVSQYLNRPVPWTITEQDEQGDDVEVEVPVPGAVKAAALLVVGDLYQTREASTERAVSENPAVKNLLNPYRVDMGV